MMKTVQFRIGGAKWGRKKIYFEPEINGNDFAD